LLTRLLLLLTCCFLQPPRIEPLWRMIVQFHVDDDTDPLAAQLAGATLAA
jgi:hypothetical protein